MKALRYAAHMVVASAAVVHPASAASIGAVGNNVEMYGENYSCSSVQTSCTVTFPLNGSKVVRIENVTCEVIVTNSGALLTAAVGPVPAPGGAFLKQSFFPQRTLGQNATFPVYVIGSYPGLLLGGGRYLQVVVNATNSISTVQCSASGVFTP